MTLIVMERQPAKGSGKMKSSISQDFIDFARDHFRLDWDGIHGASHWARVRRNGLLLVEHCEADHQVVEWFAFVHDLERRNDFKDPKHGDRAANLAEDLNSRFMRLSSKQLGLLQMACTGHSRGHTKADATVMVCWDADRLDLGRVGIYPSAKYLCTDLARASDVIEAAYRRSTQNIYESEPSRDVEEALSCDELGTWRRR